MSEKKQINMGIDDGKEFFAHETSVHFNPTQFIFDFRSVTPRVDPRTRETPYISLKHNVVLVDPWHAKELIRIMTNVIENYEKQFGKIDKPKAMKKHEKNVKKQKKVDAEKTQTPSYMG